MLTVIEGAGSERSAAPMNELDGPDLQAAFNDASEAVRIVAILSPT